MIFQLFASRHRTPDARDAVRGEVVVQTQCNSRERQVQLVRKDSVHCITEAEQQQISRKQSPCLLEKIPFNGEPKDCVAVEEYSQPKSHSGSQAWQELKAVVLSAILLAAVCIILMTIHDTPRIYWTSHFVEQATTAVKILLSASSVLLLAAIMAVLQRRIWKHSGNTLHEPKDILHLNTINRRTFHHFLSSLLVFCVCAFIGTLVFAGGSSTQQAFSLFNNTLPIEGPIASIPHKSGGDTNPAGRGYFAPMLGATIELPYRPSTTLNPTCTSEHCRWPTFETLGVCSSCEDVSAALQPRCHRYDSGNGEECVYRTPGGNVLGAGCFEQGGEPMSTLWNTSSTSGLIQLPDMMKTAVIWYPSGEQEGERCGYESGWKLPKPAATECTLKWCLKTFRSDVSYGYGMHHNNLVSSRDLIYSKQNCDLSGMAHMNWILTKDDAQAPVYAAFRSREEMPDDLCSGWQSQPNSALWIDKLESEDIADLLTTAMTRYDDTADGTMFRRTLYSGNGNLTSNFQVMTDGMIGRIRMSSTATSLSGTVWTSEMYIQVNWSLLLYPIVLLMLAVGVVVSSIFPPSEGGQAVQQFSWYAIPPPGGGASDEKLQTSAGVSTMDVMESMLIMRKERKDSGLELVEEFATLRLLNYDQHDT